VHVAEFNKRLYDRDVFEIAQRNLAPFPEARLVRGKVPDTLNHVEIEQVAYLSIDMNVAEPERAALAHFWPRMVSGGMVVFDDYGWDSAKRQRESHDAFADEHGVKILSLPTGQGLLIKP
jgi:hypothetical protein